MELLDEKDGRTVALPCRELPPEQMRAAASPLAAKILRVLAEEPMHASEIAKRLREQEQKVHYHIRKLRHAGIITIDHLEETGGATAKVLQLASPALSMRFRPLEPATKQVRIRREHAQFLAPFITDGNWNARIIIGSPDPHGHESARSRDASYAIELGMYFGTFLTSPVPAAVQLDTELRDWKQHLIIIGGPVVNKAAERINSASLAPYDFERKAFRSKMSGKSYDGDHIGIIAKMRNPLAKGKWILLIAGKRHSGTRAAILAFLQLFDSIAGDGEVLRVVEGLDADSDGMLDSVRVVE